MIESMRQHHEHTGHHVSEIGNGSWHCHACPAGSAVHQVRDNQPEIVQPIGKVTKACPSCGFIVTMVPYDIGSGPEMSCPQCEMCWGANGQPLKQLAVENGPGYVGTVYFGPMPE
jgi:hypothetical protein